MIIHIIEAVYHFLWGDLVTLHLSGTSIGIPLLVLLLIPTGIYFTFRTNFVSVRLFPDMVRSLTEKKGNGNSLSPLQTLFVSTATRVGMGNLVGVVAAVSAGVRLTEYAFFLCSSRGEPALSFPSAAGTAAGALI